jgi:hypothetical protein
MVLIFFGMLFIFKFNCSSKDIASLGICIVFNFFLQSSGIASFKALYFNTLHLTSYLASISREVKKVPCFVNKSCIMLIPFSCHEYHLTSFPFTLIFLLSQRHYLLISGALSCFVTKDFISNQYFNTSQ